MDCVYLGGKRIDEKANKGRQVYTCHIHGACTIDGRPRDIAACESCKRKLLPTDDRLAEEFLDPLIVVERDEPTRRTRSLRNILAGGEAFLFCGGPSAKQLPLAQLNQRGIYSFAVNNVAGWDQFRPNAFVCSDPPSKFCDGIWLDPTITKFVPIPKLTGGRGTIRRKLDKPIVVDPCDKCKGSGTRTRRSGKIEPCKKCKGAKKLVEYFEPLVIDGEPVRANACPNVYGFARRAWMSVDHTFFTDDHAPWGNHDSGVERTGEEKSVCTMLLAIRILYYLGARTIFLVGVDFGMDTSKSVTDNYSFGETRDDGACNSNNNIYRVVGEQLCRFRQQGVFEKFGLSIYNCNPMSRLRAFDHVPFEEAIIYARRRLPKEPFDLEGWYAK